MGKNWRGPFFEGGARDPRSSSNFPYSDNALRVVDNVVVAFWCAKCARYPAEEAPNGWMLCRECTEKLIEAEKRRSLPPVKGTCPHCGSEFEPVRHQVYCSGSCRFKAWKVRQDPDAKHSAKPGLRAVS